MDKQVHTSSRKCVLHASRPDDPVAGDGVTGWRAWLLVGLLSTAGCLSACDLVADPVRNAQWYRANMKAVPVKLEGCKRDPEGASIDAECAAAAQAFSSWQMTQAYLANPDALSAKLKSCKSASATANVDAACNAANDAFARWYAANRKWVRRARD